MLKEANTYYTIDPKEAVEVGFKQYSYKWEHIMGMTSGMHSIFCSSKSDLIKLINCWNRDNLALPADDRWHYSLIN